MTERPEFPDFDTVEAAGLDGTLRTALGSGPDGQFTWADLARKEARDEAQAALAGAVAHLSTVLAYCDEYGGDAITSDVDLGEVQAILAGVEFQS